MNVFAQHARATPGLAIIGASVVAPELPAWAEPVSVTASVSPSTAEGTVQLLVDGSPVGEPVAVNGASVTFEPIEGLASGTRTITVEYSGDRITPSQPSPPS